VIPEYAARTPGIAQVVNTVQNFWNLWSAIDEITDKYQLALRLRYHRIQSIEPTVNIADKSNHEPL